MPSLIAIFLALAASLPSRILTAIGIGVITYAGFDAVLDQIRSALVSNIGGLTGAVAGILGLGGFYTYLGIVLGAWTARISLQTLSHLGRTS